MRKVVFQFNVENAIVSVDVIDLLLQLGRPERRIVGPVALPLSAAPRISQLEQLDFFASVIQFVDRYEGVGVSGDDTLSVSVFTLASTGHHHGEVALVG